VDGALPGEVVEADAEHTAKRFVRGRLREVVQAAKSRVTPPCALADRCGGCDWQHIAAAEQSEHKRVIVANQLRAIVPDAAHVKLGGMPATGLGYRRRARLHYARDAEGGLRLGFFRGQSRVVEDTPDCPVLVPAMREALARLRGAAAVLPDEGEVLAVCDGEQTIVGLPSVRPEPEVIAALEACLDGRLVGVGLRGGRRAAVVGRGHLQLDERMGMPPVFVSPFVFTQANADVNRALVRHVTKAASSDGARVLELFCGAGNLTRVLAKTARRVWAVDDDREAIELLRKMATAHHLPVNAKKASAYNLVQRIAKGDTRYDLVVVDPPRKGLGASAVEAIAKVATERIIYVSCDPATLQRDLAGFRSAGWGIVDITVFDMMPMTSEIETVVTLAPRGVR
jgi:23S rRNA (uracil1939-C5)-methyltransferase